MRPAALPHWQSNTACDILSLAQAALRERRAGKQVLVQSHGKYEKKEWA